MIEENNLTLIDEYVDDGVSGTTFDRPQFNRLITDIENQKINMVITKDLSRLGRNYIQTGQYLEEYFPEKGVRYIAVNDNYDSFTDNNELGPFKNIINEWYAKDISKKIRFSLNSMAQRGERRKTPVPLYGYQFDSNGNRYLDPNSSNVVQLIFTKYLEMKSTYRVANFLNEQKIYSPRYYNHIKYNFWKNTYSEWPEEKKYVWTSSTIKAILRNREYLGDLITKRKELISFEYNKSLIEKMNEKKSDGIEASVQKLISIANKTENEVLSELADKVKRDTYKILQQKRETDVELENTQDKLEAAHKEINLRKQQNYFLEQAVNKNEKFLLSGMHLSLTYSEGAKGSMLDLMDALRRKHADDEEVQQYISEIMINIQKINKVSEYAIKGNFNLKSTEEENDIRDFIIQYVGMSKYKGIDIQFNSDANEKYLCIFDVSSVGIIVDNIVSNAKKAAASILHIKFSNEENGICINFSDNGRGLDPLIEDPYSIFDLGMTTTKVQGGNGIGLNHVKLLVEDMNGHVEINQQCQVGFELIVRIKR